MSLFVISHMGTNKLAQQWRSCVKVLGLVENLLIILCVLQVPHTCMRRMFPNKLLKRSLGISLRQSGPTKGQVMVWDRRLVMLFLVVKVNLRNVRCVKMQKWLLKCQILSEHAILSKILWNSNPILRCPFYMFLNEARGYNSGKFISGWCTNNGFVP